MGLFTALLGKKIQRKRVIRVVPSKKFSRRTVMPDNTPLHVKRGWKKKGNVYHGYYRTKYGAWKGSIERRGDKFGVLIHNPPKEQIEKHPRWACFHEKRGGWWGINLAINPKDRDVGAIIFYVEKVINDSFRLRGGK